MSLQSQSTLGTILGTVKDASGAVVPEAELILRNLDEGTTTPGESSTEGRYEFLNLKPGRYELTVKRTGFSTGRTPVMAVEARDTRRADFTLEIAPRVEAAVVGARVSPVDTAGGTIYDSRDFEQFNSLPLNTRAGYHNSPFAALIMVPGVQQDQGGRTSLGGGLPSHIEYSVDGVSTINIQSHSPDVALAPSSEIAAEFLVTSVNSNSQFGPMGDVTVITKSGTNQPHGSALWYHQNQALDAATYGDPQKPHKVFNTFGVSLSGPVYIPHLYNGSNRTFFFVDYEGNRQPQTLFNQLSVPTQAMRQGNLNNVPGGPPVDPDTGAPFQGNGIPANRINAVAAKLFNYYPQPNVSDPNATYNLLSNDRADTNTNGQDIRLDRWISARQSVFVRWSHKSTISLDPSLAPLPATTQVTTGKNLVLAQTFTPRASLSNEFRFGFSLSDYAEHFPLRGSDVVAKLGLIGLDLGGVGNSGGFPRFDFSDGTNFTPIGHSRLALTQSRSLQFTDTLSWIRAGHTFKFGTDMRRIGYRVPPYAGPNDDFGAFTFRSDTFSGNAFADLLLGLPAQTNYAALGPNLNELATHAAFFAQDIWRIRSGLTLDFGLRWEVHPPMREASGNITNFDHATGNVIIPDQTIPPAPRFLAAVNACPSNVSPCTKILTASQAGLPESLRKTYFGDWNPRFGFAWQPRPQGKTVIRGGIGSYTETLLGQVAHAMTGIHSSDVRIVQNSAPGGVPLFSLPNILPAHSYLGGIGTEGFYYGTDPTLHDPRSWQWNFTVERALTGSISLRASYIGVQTAGMPLLVDFNQVPASSKPFSPSLRPFPQWSQLLSVENVSFAHYQGLQVEAVRRMRNGIEFQATYVLSKNIGDVGSSGRTFFPQELVTIPVTDRFNTGYDRGNLSGARRNRFLLTGLFPLPFGKGRTFGSSSHGLAEAIFGGWELSTVTLIQTGQFQTPTVPAFRDQSNTDVSGRGVNARPDRIGDGNLPNPTPDRYYAASAFTFVPKGAGRFGNAGAGILEGPGTIAVAAGLAKTFRITEKLRMRLEGTFTNLPNHPNFSPPNTVLGNPSFGKLTFVQNAENSGNRTGQIGVRLDF
ncbi:MAG: carboxypeptidase-like regulatory domain-containing protein [Acidobacteriota bacterium]|nr:carboxypeptidase-like regulatory domain-containing protein [Acidobacteriota bacterium]